jgi:hypothetical protein
VGLEGVEEGEWRVIIIAQSEDTGDRKDTRACHDEEREISEDGGLGGLLRNFKVSKRQRKVLGRIPCRAIL